MKHRLEQFLSAENISQAQFAQSIDVARAGISHILSGRNKPSYEFIINTMSAFPRLNIEWLLCGTGKMYKDDLRTGSEKLSPSASFTGLDNLAPSGTGIKKIVIFYDDNTFEEYRMR